MKINQPLPSEYHHFYHGYIEKIGDEDVLSVLSNQVEKLRTLVEGLSQEQAKFAYAEGKWSVIEVLGHMTDVERIMSYRMLRFCRGDKTSLSGFDENDYVANARFGETSIASLLRELEYLRGANLELIGRMGEEHLKMTGESNGSITSVRALIYILAGHLQHHMSILVDRYKL